MRERSSTGVPWATILPLCSKHQAVATVGLGQNVRSKQDSDAFLIAQAFDMGGEFTASRRIEASRSFVHQKNLGLVEQRFGDLHAAAQAARKRVHQIFTPIFQAEPLHGILHAAAQCGAAESMQMPLRAEILFDRESLVQALRLEHHADRTADRRGVSGDIVPRDLGATLGGHHHGGKNAEERRLAAAIRPQQSKNLSLFHFKVDTREGNAVPVAVGQVLNCDHNPGLSRSIRP